METMTRTESWSGDPREPDDELHDDAQAAAAALGDAAESVEPAPPEETETGEGGTPGEWITGWDPEAHPGPLE
jgi:hypothetical protein